MNENLPSLSNPCSLSWEAQLRLACYCIRPFSLDDTFWHSFDFEAIFFLHNTHHSEINIFKRVRHRLEIRNSINIHNVKVIRRALNLPYTQQEFYTLSKTILEDKREPYKSPERIAVLISIYLPFFISFFPVSLILVLIFVVAWLWLFSTFLWLTG